MALDITFLEDYGIDTRLGMEYTGSEEKYISAVQRYYKNYQANKEKVEDYLVRDDIDNYTILVHALKSNSLMIGAKELSEDFKMLEMAGNNDDIATIKAKTGDTLEKYGNLIKAIEPIGKADIKPPADEISGDEAKKVADELLLALDDFNDELSSKLISKLSGYPFRLTQKEKLSKAASFIENFDYDPAVEIIKEIYDSIE